MEKDYALAKHLHNMGFEFLASYLGNLSEQTNKDADELKAEIEKLRAENEQLRETLEFYANRANWRGGWAFSNGQATMVIDADGYIPARKALKGE